MACVFAVETVCNSLNDDSEGHFYGSDGTCIARYGQNAYRDTWDNAYYSCKNRAPDGLLGRLVHIMTQDVLDWMNAEWSGPDKYWVGAKTFTGPTTTEFAPAEWFWYNDVAVPGQNLTGLPYTANTGIHASASDNCLIMVGDGSLKNAHCTAIQRRIFCQYLSKCRKCPLLL